MRDRTTSRPSRDRRRKLKASEKTEVRSKIRCRVYASYYEVLVSLIMPLNMYYIISHILYILMLLSFLFTLYCLYGPLFTTCEFDVDTSTYISF